MACGLVPYKRPGPLAAAHSLEKLKMDASPEEYVRDDDAALIWNDDDAGAVMAALSNLHTTPFAPLPSLRRCTTWAAALGL